MDVPHLILLVAFTARITNTGTRPARTAIDFVLHFRTARGVLRPKVFKLASRSIAPGGSVVVAGEPDAAGVPLLAHRPLVDGSAAAYVCRGFVCDRPVTTPEELTAALLLRP